VFDSHATNPSLQKNLPYNTVKDFTPITLIASSPMALVVHAAAPYQNLADLIAAAKAKPGELILGSGGIGSRGHLAVASLERRAGFKVTQVPYRGTSLITTDLLGRQITMQMGTVFFVAPYVKAQRLRALAVTVASRVEQLPDVPTVAEQGYPGYDVNSWWGMLAPAGVPKPVLQQLNAKLREIYASPVMRERLAQVGLTSARRTPKNSRASSLPKWISGARSCARATLPRANKKMTNRLWPAALLCVLCSQAASAQNSPQWPTKPVRFITAFPVGGSSDQVARIVAERLTAILGQQVIIDNRSGGQWRRGHRARRQRLRPTATAFSSCSIRTRPTRACRRTSLRHGQSIHAGHAVREFAVRARRRPHRPV
jgi:tripartite-type tricarboxylate transporter receptor subunit TctC